MLEQGAALFSDKKDCVNTTDKRDCSQKLLIIATEGQRHKDIWLDIDLQYGDKAEKLANIKVMDS